MIPSEIQDALLELQKRIGRLETRVSTLEVGQSSKPGRKPDEITLKIIDFLKEHAGVGFNSGSITFGIKEKDSKVVSGRLKTLVGRGVIKAEKAEGLSAMYWYEEPTNDA